MMKYILTLLLLAGSVSAGNFGQAPFGDDFDFTYTDLQSLDSGRVVFGIRNTALYDTTKLLPEDGDSTNLYGRVLAPDSSGVHYMRIEVYHRGASATSDSIYGTFYITSDIGGGIYTVDYKAFDTTGGGMSPIANVAVTFRNWALTSVIRINATNSSGIARIATDADSLAVLASSPLYSFPTAWDSVSYTADYVDTVLGYLNVPTAPADSNYVAAYIDVGTGLVDTAGAMIPRTGVELILILVGEPGIHLSDNSWAIISKEYKETPNSLGRVTFTVPASTVMTPSGSHYELRYEATDGFSYTSGLIRKFIIATTPDPLNILTATKAW